MVYHHEVNEETGGILFRRSPLGRNSSLVLGLVAIIVFFTGLIYSQYWFGIIKLFFGPMLMAISIINFLRYQRLPQLMYFSNRKQSFIVGNWSDYTEIPYAEIHQIQLSEDDPNNYYIYLCLKAGGRWFLKSFGKDRDAASVLLEQLKDQISYNAEDDFLCNAHLPAVQIVKKADSSVLTWRSKELSRYIILTTLFIPFVWLLWRGWSVLSLTEQTYSVVFFIFTFTVSIFKVVKGVNTYRFVECSPEEVKVGIRSFGNEKILTKHKVGSQVHFVLNFFPLASHPAFSANFILINNDVDNKIKDGELDYNWLKRMFLKQNNNDIHFIDVQSLNVAQRVDLYYYLKPKL